MPLLIERLGAVPWRAIPNWFLGNRLKIWMIHSVADNPHDPHALSPTRFLSALERLACPPYHVIPLGEALDRLDGGRSLRNLVVLTFDDAYRDFLSTALPLIDRFDMPATLFVPTGLVGQRAIWDTYCPEKPLLNWDELALLPDRNITLASHGVSHRSLTSCSDRELQDELAVSFQYLAERFDNFLPVLSYPGGFHTHREQNAARKAGYRAAVGVASRWGNGPETDRYALRRMHPTL